MFTKKILICAASVFLTLSQNTKATDVCASDLLIQEVANRLCPNDCKNAGATSWGGNWVPHTSMDCKTKYPKNTEGSVCGCTFTGCTDLNTDYDMTTAPGGEYEVDWTASIWYTPCGHTKEAPTAAYARKWRDNHLSIQKGTRLRIGPEGTARNLIDTTVIKDHIDIVCGGPFGGGPTGIYCREGIPAPITKCTEVIIDYDATTKLTVEIHYTACGAPLGADEKRETASERTGNSYSIRSDTNVTIRGLFMPFSPPYLTKKMSGPKINVLCGGDLTPHGTTYCKEVR